MYIRRKLNMPTQKQRRAETSLKQISVWRSVSRNSTLHDNPPGDVFRKKGSRVSLGSQPY